MIKSVSVHHVYGVNSNRIRNDLKQLAPAGVDRDPGCLYQPRAVVRVFGVHGWRRRYVAMGVHICVCLWLAILDVIDSNLMSDSTNFRGLILEYADRIAQLFLHRIQLTLE